MIPCAVVMTVDGRYQDKIPTGFIVAGPSIAAHHELFDAIARRIANEDAGTVLIVNAAQATNLKALLKHINQHGTLQRIDGREDGLFEDVHQASSGSRRREKQLIPSEGSTSVELRPTHSLPAY